MYKINYLSWGVKLFAMTAIAVLVIPIMSAVNAELILHKEITNISNTIPEVKVIERGKYSDFQGDVLVIDFSSAKISPNVLVLCRVFVQKNDDRFNFASFWLTNEVLTHKRSYLVRTLPFADFDKGWEEYDVGLERYIYTDRTHKILPDLILHQGKKR